MVEVHRNGRKRNTLMSAAIHIENLSKTFGRRALPLASMPRGLKWLSSRRVEAVRGLNLEVQPGQVYGFLGPNGAGKTTTIRMILDLIRPSAGSIRLFGKEVQHQREVLGRVGSLVEGAHFYPFLTGRRNLEVLMLTAGLPVDQTHIDALLNQVGMAERSRRQVNGYSTGMKQRLGLAAALLENPDLVILDEPTNGLDPHGIQEVRSFIRSLASEQGKTVFLSSHLLGEVEQVCDRVAIIHRGQIIHEGAVADLLAQRRLSLRAEPLEQASNILSEHWKLAPSSSNRHLLIEASADDAPAIVEALVAQQVKVYEIGVQRESLEAFFLAVTEEIDRQ